MLKNIRKNMQDDKGFTLIELMVVVLIIAILIAIAIPTFLGLRRRAQDRAAQSNLRNGFTATKAFYTDCESWAPPATCGPTFNGVTHGEAIEPSLTWVDGALPAAPVVGSVYVTSVAAQVLVLEAGSASGTTFCIAEDTSLGTVRGRDSGGGGFGTYALCNAALDW